MMKAFVKRSLAALGLLGLMQEVNYRMSFLNRNNMHPRKRVYLFYRQFISKGQLVFDIGANVGDRVAVFHELGGITVAVEPQFYCAEKMTHRFGGNRRVHIENVGLGETEGEMDFYICDDDDRLSTFSNDQMQNSFFSGSTRWNRKEVIKVLTLDQLIEKYGVPGFCKIDVEGYELNVLKGLNKSIPAISFEFSSKQLEKAKDCMLRLSNIDRRYKFNVCFGEPYALHFDSWVEKEKVLAEIEVQDKSSETHAWGDIYVQLV
jgi:FkbM family methyltransferase